MVGVASEKQAERGYMRLLHGLRERRLDGQVLETEVEVFVMADYVTRGGLARYPARYGVHLNNIIGRISWGGVWAGLMITLGMETLLTFIGLFVGFRRYDWTAAHPWAGFSGWTSIWFLITLAWSMYFGAWCAARLSGNPVREAGVLHGITVWAFACIVTMGVAVLGSWSVLREGVNIVSTAAIAGAEVAPAAVNRATPSEASRAAQQGEEAVNQLQQNAGPMKQATADTLSRLSLFTGAGLLLGLIAAIIGGLVGRPRSVVIEELAPTAPSSLAA
jgi:hypothetical protein